MIENPEKKETEPDKDKFNPFSFLAILLYYPALGLAIRLGFSAYFYLFDDLKGLNIIWGIIVALIITIIFTIIAVFFINLLMKLGNKIWKYIVKKKNLVKLK